MSNAATRITEFVLDRLVDEPIATRIAVKRDLARLAQSPAEAKRLNALADELESFERRHRQLVLDFKRRAEG